MLFDFVAILRQVVRYFVANSAPGHLAAGFTIGMAIGLAPKGNLIALSLCVVLFSIRCNRGLGLAAATMFSFVGTWTDPFAHKLGDLALSFEPLQATYASVFSLPLGPWIGFNNTVVTGAVLTTLYVAYPVFWIMRQFFTAVESLASSRRPGCIPQVTLESTP
jgi:uncharacterized protein (TIGR03546 family)